MKSQFGSERELILADLQFISLYFEVLSCGLLRYLLNLHSSNAVIHQLSQRNTENESSIQCVRYLLLQSLSRKSCTRLLFLTLTFAFIIRHQCSPGYKSDTQFIISECVFCHTNKVMIKLYIFRGDVQQ